jgi:hypothetical protein
MKGSWPLAGLFVLLAIFFVVLAVLYEAGSIEFLTTSGTAHAHHTTHAIASAVLAVLCLVAANIARPKAAA